jgi:hypothetical protein
MNFVLYNLINFVFAKILFVKNKILLVYKLITLKDSLFWKNKDCIWISLYIVAIYSTNNRS